jgi:ComF family protein
LIEAIAQTYRENELPELLIPIPMHRKKQNARGYNQADLICRRLSRSLRIKQSNNILLKTRQTKSQAGLNKTERLQNLKGSLKTVNESTIKGQHIALVDDVVTTKATAEISSEVLLSAGAKRVDIWCLARTPLFR